MFESGVTICKTAPPQSAAVQHAPHSPSGQQYGRPLSEPLDWHSTFEQHSRQPSPGQHTVPSLQALTYSQVPSDLQRPTSQGFVATHSSSVVHSPTGMQPTSMTHV
jgi:hypothetical protein